MNRNTLVLNINRFEDIIGSIYEEPRYNKCQDFGDTFEDIINNEIHNFVYHNRITKYSTLCNFIIEFSRINLQEYPEIKVKYLAKSADTILIDVTGM